MPIPPRVSVVAGEPTGEAVLPLYRLGIDGRPEVP